MSGQNISVRADEMARASLRENGVVEQMKMPEGMAKALGSVTIDRELVSAKIADILSQNGNNPVNSILKLFGLKLVRPESELRYVDDMLSRVEPDGDGECLSGFLRLDENELKNAIDLITLRMKKVENERLKALESKQSELDDMTKQLAKCREELENELALKEKNRRAVAEQLQYMLTISDELKLAEQLTELLEDMGLRAVYDEEGERFPQSAMFTLIKCDKPDSRKGKPCIVDSDGVYLKGIRFIKG